jgi:hypothetical protein
LYSGVTVKIFINLLNWAISQSEFKLIPGEGLVPEMGALCAGQSGRIEQVEIQDT